MAFFGLLKKKQKIFEEETNMEDNNISKTGLVGIDLNSDLVKQTGSIPVQMKTYDILVFEPDEDGSMKQKQVSGLKAFSAQDLIGMYAAEGAKVRILREYGDSLVGGIPQKQEDRRAQHPRDVRPPTPSPNFQPQQQQFQPSSSINIPQQEKLPPKFFDIGGVKCKLDNGKMYQEQWVRVDPSKYRLISDANNKVISLTGKHIETLKWVLIEDNDNEFSEGVIENA